MQGHGRLQEVLEEIGGAGKAGQDFLFLLPSKKIGTIPILFKIQVETNFI